MDDQFHQFEWKAALALNSAASTMSERGCYQQAYATLADSMLVMQQTSAPEEARSIPAVLGKLDIAYRRIFSPYVLPPGPASVVVVHHDGVELQGYTQEPPSLPRNQFCIIRMETTSVDPHEASAILLYNYAITRLCIAINDRRGSRFQYQEYGAVCKPLHAALAMLCSFVTRRVLNLMYIIGDALVPSNGVRIAS
jgi:hypothetical protein